MREQAKILADDGVFSTEEFAGSDPLNILRQLGLIEKVAEIDAHGYAVIGPDEWDDRGLTPQLKDKLLEVAERRSGIRPDFETGSTHINLERHYGQHMFYLLTEDPVFEAAITHDVPYALVDYFLGESATLSSLSGGIRGPGAPGLELHTDMIMAPSPLPFYPQVFNINWAITDYTPENGSTCFWPGSHKYCRRPTAAERAAKENFVPVTTPAGSLIFWHGNTWHGSFPRTNTGVRIQMAMFFCRQYFLPQEWYRDTISDEAISRGGPRLRIRAALDNPYPFPREGPDFLQLSRANSKTVTLHG